jgi:hypothetical protein
MDIFTKSRFSKGPMTPLNMAMPFAHHKYQQMSKNKIQEVPRIPNLNGLLKAQNLPRLNNPLRPSLGANPKLCKGGHDNPRIPVFFDSPEDHSHPEWEFPPPPTQ